MVREAESNAEDDRRKKEEVETRNNADSLAYAAEKMLRDNADKVPADLKAEVEGKIAQVRSALQSGDTDQIKRSTDELQESMQKVGAAVYSQQQSQGPTDGADPSGGSHSPAARAPMARPSPAPWKVSSAKCNPFLIHKSQTMARHAEHVGPSFLSVWGMSPPLHSTPATTVAPAFSDQRMGTPPGIHSTLRPCSG